MEFLLEKNRNFLFSKKVFFSHTNSMKKLVSALNTKKIAIVSGVKYSGKTKFVYDLLEKTNATQHAFYINSELDTLGKIKYAHDIDTLLELHKRTYWNPKIIILQNINKVSGIKDYIGELYTSKKYKIIIVGNNIQIGGVTEIQIFPLSLSQLGKEKIPQTLQYGTIEEVQLVRDLYFKNFLLKTITENIISQDALYTYDIKNKKLYYSVLSFLAKIQENISIRELQRELEIEWVSISLVTLMDYIDISTKSKILAKVSKYDIKSDKEIPTKITYYFSDTGIRNVLTGTIDTPYIAIKNTLLNELQKCGYTVYTGVNGKFHMTFRAYKHKEVLSIHIHESSDKNELKKDARKLSKLSDNSKKFLIVADKSIYNMRKYKLDDVIVGELGEVVDYL